MKTRNLKFGDIYTNGINYWMITWVKNNGCDCKCHILERTHELTPVVMEDNNPTHFVGTYSGQLSDIKPCARYVMSAKFDVNLEGEEECMKYTDESFLKSIEDKAKAEVLRDMAKQFFHNPPLDNRFMVELDGIMLKFIKDYAKQKGISLESEE